MFAVFKMAECGRSSSILYILYIAERSKRKKVKRKRIDEVDRNWRQMVGGRFEN